MTSLTYSIALLLCCILVTLPFIVLYAIFDEEIVSFMSDDPEYVTYRSEEHTSELQSR